jgi:hypothetical protein
VVYRSRFARGGCDPDALSSFCLLDMEDVMNFHVRYDMI